MAEYKFNNSANTICGTHGSEVYMPSQPVFNRSNSIGNEISGSTSHSNDNFQKFHPPSPMQINQQINFVQKNPNFQFRPNLPPSNNVVVSNPFETSIKNSHYLDQNCKFLHNSSNDFAKLPASQINNMPRQENISSNYCQTNSFMYTNSQMNLSFSDKNLIPPCSFKQDFETKFSGNLSQSNCVQFSVNHPSTRTLCNASSNDPVPLHVSGAETFLPQQSFEDVNQLPTSSQNSLHIMRNVSQNETPIPSQNIHFVNNPLAMPILPSYINSLSSNMPLKGNPCMLPSAMPKFDANPPSNSLTNSYQIEQDVPKRTDIPQVSMQNNFYNMHYEPSMPLPNIPLPIFPYGQYITPIQNSDIAENQFYQQDLREKRLVEFLQKFHSKPSEANKEKSLSVAEFRSSIKIGLMILKMLSICKSNLTQMIHSNDDIWKSEMEKLKMMQNQLSDICNVTTLPNNIMNVQKRLEKIKKKRVRKQKAKQNRIALKKEREKERKIIDHEIDKWLDSIKEKNLKMKREIEMKKEADNILSEVRRKIHEAKRTIEKIKIFEKLRNARKENAMQKSLFTLPEQDKEFQYKITILKEAMVKQLSDYEAEERALKVMLETEREDQLEEEARWRLKKLKQIQTKKQEEICECLFGKSEDPSPGDPLYFFWQYHTAANCSVENLVKIRHHWDMYLVSPDSEEESLPQQWVVPIPPSSKSWEMVQNIT